jgi:hypothetical protein
VALALAVLLGAGERVCFRLRLGRQPLAHDARRRVGRTIPVMPPPSLQNARLRPERLPAFGAADESRATLRLLLRHRRDLVADRTRTIARLRDTLLSYSPGLERAFESRSQGALLLLSRYNRPAAIRRAGAGCIERHLAGQGVRAPQRIASAAVRAAKA